MSAWQFVAGMVASTAILHVAGIGVGTVIRSAKQDSRRCQALQHCYITCAMQVGRWCFIIFQLVWLNVVLPGHTRGSITLPGTKPTCHTEAKADSCCSTKREPKKDSDKGPTQDQKNRCAFCYFAMGLDTPPVFTIDHLFHHTLAAELHVDPAEVVSSFVFLPYNGRGPPLA